MSCDMRSVSVWVAQRLRFWRFRQFLFFGSRSIFVFLGSAVDYRKEIGIPPPWRRVAPGLLQIWWR